ncbi:hypothetical protein MLD38_014240 [Melastoma candidum]|uniref:Uncharacterized protein n=1 Tax=Melastoma candidum TaxID=119954 RepID=A0ACB9RC36_9MYRT|nr:hypothetical protein MLD38_014240 [Melastoma candidum]
MLGKRSRSVIGRLSQLLLQGSSLSSLLDGPLYPFLRRPHPSDNPSLIIRNLDLGYHGVGLGIVVALDKQKSMSSSGSGGGTGPYSKYLVPSREVTADRSWMMGQPRRRTTPT